MLLRKSSAIRGTVVWIAQRLYFIAEATKLPNHSCRAASLRFLAYGRASASGPFSRGSMPFVTPFKHK